VPSGVPLSRSLVATAAAVVCIALPAVAQAAPSITVTPANLQAGGSPNVTTDAKLGTGGTPKTITIDLAPGFSSYATANPSCLAKTTLSKPCEIGAGTLGANGAVPVSIQMFLVPPKSGTDDFAGVDVVAAAPLNVTTYSGVSVTPTAGLALSATLPSIPLVSFTELKFTLNAKLNGNPFTRLPTSCGPATTTLKVTYVSAPAASASGSFTPTGCDALPYSPVLSASVVKDRRDNGVTVVSTISQAGDEAATKATTLTIPPAVAGPNGLVAIKEVNSPVPVGSATASSPLVSGALVGDVFFTGTVTSPTFTIRFPAPFAVTLVGTVSLATNAVTFSGPA